MNQMQLGDLWEVERLKAMELLVGRGVCDGYVNLVVRNLGKRGGHYQGCRGDGTVTLNTQLLAQPDADLTNTLRHELAHWVASALRHSLGVRSRRGRWSSHGLEWKRAALALGCTGDRCHTMALEPTRKVRQWLYLLECGTEVKLSTVRHNKVMRGYTYRLKSTKSKLSRECFIREAA